MCTEEIEEGRGRREEEERKVGGIYTSHLGCPDFHCFGFGFKLTLQTKRSPYYVGTKGAAAQIFPPGHYTTVLR
jgi:hypothetical protein